nr:alpha/beta fold hydrolase [Polaribacter pacificus]
MKETKNIVLKGPNHKPIVLDVFANQNKQPKPVLIFCHGYKGFKDWGAWNIMAKAFADAGFFFVKFNFSHNGGTVNQPIDFPDLEAFGNNNYTKELDDLKTVIDWVFTNPEIQEELNVEELSLMGHSRGGGIVTIKAEEDTRVSKVISLAGVCDLAKRTATSGNLDQWKKDGVKYVLNGRTKQNMPHFYQFYEDFLENETRLTIKRAVSNLQIPYLILHGTQDSSVLIDEAIQLHSWNPKSQFNRIEKANHVFNTSHPWHEPALSTQLAEVVKLSIAFLKK